MPRILERKHQGLERPSVVGFSPAWSRSPPVEAGRHCLAGGARGASGSSGTPRRARPRPWRAPGRPGRRAGRAARPVPGRRCGARTRHLARRRRRLPAQEGSRCRIGAPGHRRAASPPGLAAKTEEASREPGPWVRRPVGARDWWEGLRGCRRRPGSLRPAAAMSPGRGPSLRSSESDNIDYVNYGRSRPFSFAPRSPAIRGARSPPRAGPGGPWRWGHPSLERMSRAMTIRWISLVPS